MRYAVRTFSFYQYVCYVRTPRTRLPNTVGGKRTRLFRETSPDAAHVFTANVSPAAAPRDNHNAAVSRARLICHEISRQSICVTVSVISTDLYYERIHRHQRHHEQHGPSVVVGERSADGGQPAPGAKKPQTPYTIEEILKPTAPRPRPPSPCGLLVDGVCTCGLAAGSVVSAAFYADVQQQYMQCSQHLRY